MSRPLSDWQLTKKGVEATQHVREQKRFQVARGALSRILAEASPTSREFEIAEAAIREIAKIDKPKIDALPERG